MDSINGFHMASIQCDNKVEVFHQTTSHKIVGCSFHQVVNEPTLFQARESRLPSLSTSSHSLLHHHVTDDLEVSSYIFFTTIATGLGLLLHLLVLVQKYKENEWRVHMEGTDVAALHMVLPLDLLSPLVSKQGPTYTWFLK
ncbi:hypothetical protein EJ110_NYTH11165 [Nymphaea thermarum]|nr:hypothetical protein EJ110_NYTH11165 [Nymphaea thermarum]